MTFASNKQITATKQLIVLEDRSAIINSINTVVYGAIASAWYDEYGEVFPSSYVYRTHLLSLHGELDFSIEVNGAVLGSSLVTLNNRSLLKYLPNVTSLVFDGCN
jgi:hypothetical protein